jgi:3-dehydroquinate synthase
VPGSFPCQLSADPQPAAGQRRFIVIDENVHSIYGKKIEQYFEAKGVAYKVLALPTREANKEFDLVFAVADALEDFGINRRKEPIIAIGGGVCLDVTGLAANLYRRNTPVIKIPTTVMAAIDASIGIKTAVNFHQKKNKLGTYCAPLAVFIDRSFLRTLDHRNLSNGSAEMLKMACVKDAELFNLLEAHGERFIHSGFQGPVAGTAMRRSIQGMLEELEYNLWEHILCRLVDYGHTFSPEIEMAALASGDELLHGEAVNIDMALTTQISFARGMLTLDERNRVFRLMRSLQLPFWHPVCSPELFYKGLKDTTKARDGYQRVPLMDGIGEAKFVNNVTKLELMTAACVLHTIADSHTSVFDKITTAPEVVSSVVPARDLHVAQPLAESAPMKS